MLPIDALRFEDEGSGTAASSRTVAAGLGDEPRAWVRLLANAVVDRYADAARVPEPRTRWYVTLLGRAQLVVP